MDSSTILAWEMESENPSEYQGLEGKGVDLQDQEVLKEVRIWI
jgi:hypothetical protein